MNQTDGWNQFHNEKKKGRYDHFGNSLVASNLKKLEDVWFGTLDTDMSFDKYVETIKLNK